MKTMASMHPKMKFVAGSGEEKTLIDKILKGMIELVKPFGRMQNAECKMKNETEGTKSHDKSPSGAEAHKVGTIYIIHREGGKELRVVNTAGKVFFSVAFNQKTADELAVKLLMRGSPYRAEGIKIKSDEDEQVGDNPIKSITFFDL